jgi:hypothetical protein
MGNAMLKEFHESIPPTLEGIQEILGVELPLAATLFSDDVQPTEFKLAGILDLVLLNRDGKILVVDNKTASNPAYRAGHHSQ